MPLLAGFAGALALGFSVAAAPGPVGALCLERALARGRASGFASGLGAATADALLALAGALGLAGVLALVGGGHVAFRAAGGILLLWLAWRSWRAPVEVSAASARGGSLAADYAGVVALTLVNPMTIATFGLAFAALDLAPAGGSLAGSAAFALGVFLGSAAWWLALTIAASALRERLTAAWRRRVARGSAVLVAAMGAAAVGSAAAAFV